jgi:PAS domain-containing protein
LPVVEGQALAHPEIQSSLLIEAMLAARAGLLVWDEHRRYIAANPAACEILGTTLEDLLGQEVGAHSKNVDEPLEEALHRDLVWGTAEVEAFDGSGPRQIFYATFRTTTAGMPYMATLIARLPDDWSRRG